MHHEYVWNYSSNLPKRDGTVCLGILRTEGVMYKNFLPPRNLGWSSNLCFRFSYLFFIRLDMSAHYFVWNKQKAYFSADQVMLYNHNSIDISQLTETSSNACTIPRNLWRVMFAQDGSTCHMTKSPVYVEFCAMFFNANIKHTTYTRIYPGLKAVKTSNAVPLWN